MCQHWPRRWHNILPRIKGPGSSDTGSPISATHSENCGLRSYMPGHIRRTAISWNIRGDSQRPYATAGLPRSRQNSKRQNSLWSKGLGRAIVNVFVRQVLPSYSPECYRILGRRAQGEFASRELYTHVSWLYDVPPFHHERSKWVKCTIDVCTLFDKVF